MRPILSDAFHEQTTILILATSHPFPLHSEVGSSAFSYVDFECSAIINEHNRLRADSRSTCEFLLPEIANTFQGGYQAVAVQNVSASFRTPKTQVHVALRRLAECSRAGCYLSPLWPRVVARHGRCQSVALVQLFLPHKRLPIPSALVRVIHVVGRTLGSQRIPNCCRWCMIRWKCDGPECPRGPIRWQI